MTPVLRPYQLAVIGQFRRALAGGERRVLMVAPTG
jgi:superfamily II DNA or RNA helicase